MQAFLYRHLVPARELTLASEPTPASISFEVRTPPSGIFELPMDKEVRIPLKGFVHMKRQGTTVSVDQPPEGLSIVNGWIGRPKGAGPGKPQAGGTLVVKAEAPLQPGDRITLIPVAVIKQGKDEIRYPAPAITVTITPAGTGS